MKVKLKLHKNHLSGKIYDTESEFDNRLIKHYQKMFGEENIEVIEIKENK